jgi:mono/diheme cytochrome c family protein
MPALRTFIFIAAAAAAQAAHGQDAGGIEYFEKRIRPLFAAKCLSCHGAGKSVFGGLHMETRAGMLKGGDHGPALTAGKPEQSLLIKAVSYTDPKLRMPPNGRLSDAEITALTEWVRMGAPDPRTASGPKKPQMMPLAEGRKWWAFQPLSKPTPPPTPRTGPLANWAKTGADRFILAGLTKAGLQPNPSADRRTLIRRAYFDLIGLPPTPKEVEAFVHDKSPRAWETVVDRLLASPRYGERWGRHWLDLARYAESHGYEQDYDRPNAYTYRDTVIKLLNMDLPYTTFVKWQLAGDEFEPENPLAVMATGFLGAGTHATQITKSQVEKERYDELDDMLSVSSSVFLGLTVGCARCHDHKYDPIPSRDYYRMLSTFTTTVRSDQEIALTPDADREASARWQQGLRRIEEEQRAVEQGRVSAFAKGWYLSAGREKPRHTWRSIAVKSAVSAGGATLRPLPDNSVLAIGKRPDNDTYTLTFETQLPRVAALRLEALSHPSLMKGGPGRAANGNFALTGIELTAQPMGGGPESRIRLLKPRATFEQNGLSIVSAVAGTPKAGWAVDPQIGRDHAAAFTFEKPTASEGGARFTLRLKFENNTAHSIGRLRISLAQEADADLLAEAVPETVLRVMQRAAETPWSELESADQQAVIGYVRTHDVEWQKLQAEYEALLAGMPLPVTQKAMICSEGVPAIRTHTQGGDYLENTHFLRRGDPNNKGEVATQAFLTVLTRHPMGEKYWQEKPPAGWRTTYQRRSFANWMTDMENGAGALLARVIVNRLWQRHMGRGIVATASDFGTQGEKPANPQLLDWLAGELVRSGWRLKPIHRLMMLSAVYQQSAALNSVAAKRDPENRLCWRHPRKRLEAEALRDSMLALSGELDETMYGPGTLREDSRRRSIYFFIKRSRLIPSLILFDAPNSLQSIAMRQTTTVAPQALMLLNSAQVRHWAEAFARRCPQEASPQQQVRFLYREALGRDPKPAELLDAAAFLKLQAETHRRDGVTDADRQSLADLAQVIFGLNEFIYVD